MFCPKCGTQNPETGKFCRSCGTDLGNISAVISGNLPANLAEPGVVHLQNEAKRRSDPNEIYADAIKNIIWAAGFLIVSMALLITGVAGGNVWWWAMLIPAFSFLSKGISDLVKSKKIAESRARSMPASQPSLERQPQHAELPPDRTEYVSPESAYRTGDLVPPSVTEGTTRHLEIDSEGKTMTLPKK